MEVTMQYGTREFYRVKVERTDRPSYDPTGDLVQFAFLPRGSAWSEDLWGAGTWDTVDGIHYALGLVGTTPPDDYAGDLFDLPAGSYSVFTRIIDDPENPKDLVGTLRLKEAPSGR